MSTPQSDPERPTSYTSSEYPYEYNPGSSIASSRTSSAASLKKTITLPRRVQEALKKKGFTVNEYGTVTMGLDSRSHPRNWSLKRKCYDTAFICFQEFWMTLISNTGTAVTAIAAGQLDISQTFATFCFVTTYMFGQAFGSLIFPPLSETLGTRWIWIATCACYLLFNLFISIWPMQIGVIITFRFLAGMASAIPATVACGSLENLWDCGARIFAIWAWICCAVLGLGQAPALTTYVSGTFLGWPFVYGIAAIVSCVSLFLSYFMKESRPEQYLEQEVRKISKIYQCSELHVDTKPWRSWHKRLQDFSTESLKRPVVLFFTEPIVAAVSIMAAFVYGLVYLFSESTPIVYVEGFGLSEEQSSWVTMAFAVAIPLTLLPRIRDIHVAKKCKNAGKELEPEQKLFGFYVAAPVLAIGLWTFGLTIHPLTDVPMWISIASLVLIGYGVIEFDSVLSGYLTDCYNSYAASANAPMSFLRCILSGVFPLFAQTMFREIGRYPANSAVFVLAGLATIFCGVAVVFRMRSKSLRENSKFAEKTALSPTNSEQGLVESETKEV